MSFNQIRYHWKLVFKESKTNVFINISYQKYIIKIWLKLRWLRGINYKTFWINENLISVLSRIYLIIDYNY
jgi:hypothetical protein